MANATASKKETAGQTKPKPKDAEAQETKPAKTGDPRPARVSARVNLTTTKVIEGQFDTTAKKVEELDKKLVEVEQKFSDKPDHPFALKVKASREALASAAENLVTAKDEFAEIGETLRDFFA